MSALHTAVARAMAYADWQAPPEIPIPVGARHDRMAAVAIGVVLAEAQRSIEALRATDPEHPYEADRDRALDEALAVLTALGEHA